MPIIGKAVNLVSGPGGLAFLAAHPAAGRPAGRAQPAAGRRARRDIPAAIRRAVILRDQHCR